MGQNTKNAITLTNLNIIEKWDGATRQVLR